jgi:hypothetical protein
LAQNGTDWEITGDEVASCNCNWSCPCQFNALPSEGHCEAMIAWEITEGHFGDVSLNGVRFAEIVHFPGAIHEGNGVSQPVIDAKATDQQRDAMLALLSGEHGGTYFEIFSTVISEAREPARAAITIDVDRDARRGRVLIDGLGESRIEPIKNPVTGEEHRIRIDLPDGFEYELAEIANTVSFKTTAGDPLDLRNEETYAQLNEFSWSNAA